MTRLKLDFSVGIPCVYCGSDTKNPNMDLCPNCRMEKAREIKEEFADMMRDKMMDEED